MPLRLFEVAAVFFGVAVCSALGFHFGDFSVDAFDPFVRAALPLVFVPDELPEIAPVIESRIFDNVPNGIAFHGGGEKGPTPSKKVGAVKPSAVFRVIFPFMALHAWE